MKKLYKTKKNKKNLKKYTKKEINKHQNTKKNRKSIKWFLHRKFKNGDKDVPFVIIKSLKSKKGGDIIPYNFYCDKSTPNCKTWLSLPIDTGTTVANIAKTGYDTAAYGISGVATTAYDTAAYGVSGATNLFTGNNIGNEIKKKMEEKCGDEDDTTCQLEKVPEIISAICKKKYPSDDQIKNYDDCYYNNGIRLMCDLDRYPGCGIHNKAKLNCERAYLSKIKTNPKLVKSTFMYDREGVGRSTGDGSVDRGCVNNMEEVYSAYNKLNKKK